MKKTKKWLVKSKVIFPPQSFWFAGGIFLIVVIFSFLYLWYRCSYKDFVVGKPAPRDFVVTKSFTYIDIEETKKRRKKAVSSIKEVLVLDEKAITDFMKKIDLLKKGGVFFLPEDIATEVMLLSPYKRSKIADLLKDVLLNFMEKGITSENLPFVKARVKEVILSTPGLTKREKEIAFLIAERLLVPTLKPSFLDVVKLRKKLEEEIPVVKVRFRPGDIIVKKGEILTSKKYDIIKAINPNLGKFPFVNLCVLVIVVVLFEVWFYIRKLKKQMIPVNEVWHISIISSFPVIVGAILFPFYRYTYPLVFTGIVGFLTLKKDLVFEVLLYLGIVEASVIGVGLGYIPAAIILGAFLMALLGWSISKSFTARHRVVLISLLFGFVFLFVDFWVCAWEGVRFEKPIWLPFMWSLIWGVVGIVMLPLFEYFVKVVSPFRLIELGNPSHPLLKRLQLEAPGTYYHSLMVGNMAEMAADALNLDSLLVRVGAYYHDIGKLKRPRFFVENQFGEDNVHEQLSPNMSSIIIISHVKDGLEYAEEYKLPEVIKDFIRTHHGTTCLSYFYQKALAVGDDSVKKDQFCYPGPKPFSKETALVMLADSVEAAIRSVNKKWTYESLKDMVKDVIDSKYKEGQLSDVELTFKELEIIADAFARVLISAYHNREIKQIDEIIKELEGKNIKGGRKSGK